MSFGWIRVQGCYLRRCSSWSSNEITKNGRCQSFEFRFNSTMKCSQCFNGWVNDGDELQRRRYSGTGCTGPTSTFSEKTFTTRKTFTFQRNVYKILSSINPSAKILDGDFCQTLPVIPSGIGADEVDTCIKSPIYGGMLRNLTWQQTWELIWVVTKTGLHSRRSFWVLVIEL